MAKQNSPFKLDIENPIQLIIGGSLLLVAIVLIVMDPQSLKSMIQVDVEKKIFGGTMTALCFAAALLFLWLGSRKTKDELKDAKDGLETAKQALDKAASQMSGRLGTLHLRIGPNALQTALMRVQNGSLTGRFEVRNGAQILQEGPVHLYRHAVANVWIAELKDVMVDNDNLISVTLTDGQQEWSASESIRIRMVNFAGV